MIHQSRMYNLQIEQIISKETNIYELVVASAKLAQELAGIADEEGIKPTTKALTDLVDKTAHYELKSSE